MWAAAAPSILIMASVSAVEAVGAVSASLRYMSSSWSQKAESTCDADSVCGTLGVKRYSYTTSPW